MAGWCRVYYSTDSVLPAWIPGWAKTGLINIAAKTATAWVDKYCQVAQVPPARCYSHMNAVLVMLMAAWGAGHPQATAQTERRGVRTRGGGTRLVKWAVNGAVSGKLRRGQGLVDAG